MVGDDCDTAGAAEEGTEVGWTDVVGSTNGSAGGVLAGGTLAGSAVLVVDVTGAAVVVEVTTTVVLVVLVVVLLVLVVLLVGTDGTRSDSNAPASQVADRATPR